MFGIIFLLVFALSHSLCVVLGLNRILPYLFSSLLILKSGLIAYFDLKEREKRMNQRSQERGMMMIVMLMRILNDESLAEQRGHEPMPLPNELPHIFFHALSLDRRNSRRQGQSLSPAAADASSTRAPDLLWS
jgi:UDP-N-acetylmuramyl pentapeptide phosphotransferase/UDP-N-acetylglucosamine-1-phosphate transferase